MYAWLKNEYGVFQSFRVPGLVYLCQASRTSVTYNEFQGAPNSTLPRALYGRIVSISFVEASRGVSLTLDDG